MTAPTDPAPEHGATPGGHGIDTWSAPQWRERAVTWLDARLAAAGTPRTGAVTQPHLRPWGTVLTAPTARGPVWMKAPGPDTAFEVRLYPLFSEAAPQWTLPPIAVDVEQGWILLPDGGPTLGDRLSDTDLVDALVEILPQYGRFQRALAPHADTMVQMGIADMRAAAMPQRFDEAAQAVGAYIDDYGDAADRDVHRRALAMRATFANWCARLAAGAVPPSLDHNDLHPWNILPAVPAASTSSAPAATTTAPGAADGADTASGPARFYDWGDAVVAHPFASMLIGLGIIPLHLGVGADDPAVRRPRDAYLDVFSDLAPHAELVQELELACRVAKVARVLTWERSLRSQSREQAGAFARAPLNSLTSLLEESWIALGPQP